MNRMAFAVHRYGKEVNGGVEDHCRMLAEMMSMYYSVDVLTSCSLREWDNHFSPGVTVEDGINIIRFSVKEPPRDNDIYRRIGPFCPDMIDYLIENASKYEVIVFLTYNFGLVGLRLINSLNNVILLPTAHNEPTLRHDDYRIEFSCAKGILFNSVEEKALIRSLFPVDNIPSRTTCFGIDHMDYQIKSKQINYRYILYVGRVSRTKKFDVLNEYFVRYKKEHESDLKLVVVGRIDNYMTIHHHEDIILTGFVSEEDKMSYYHGAECVVCPSELESLCIALLESFACKRPVLVNGECDVMKGQCIRSNGGLYYSSYMEFEAELNFILSHKEISNKMGIYGYRYVKEEYNPELVKNNLLSLIDEINGKKCIDNEHVIEDYIPDRSLFDIRNIVKNIHDSIEINPRGMSKFENYSLDLIQKLSNNRKIVIVGAGNKGREAREFLEDNKIGNIVCFADNGDNEFVSVTLACSKYSDATFLVTPRYHMTEIMRELLSYGISAEQIELYMR